MSDISYLLEIVAKLRDEVSPGIDKLKAKIDSLKATNDAEAAEKDLGKAVEDRGRKEDEARRKTEAGRVEKERSRRASEDASRGAKDLARDTESLGKKHDDSAQSVGAHTKAQEDFADALAKVKRDSQDAGDGVEDLRLRTSKLNTAWNDFQSDLNKGSFTKGEAARGLKEFSSEFTSLSRKLQTGSQDWKDTEATLDRIGNKLKSSDFGSSGGFISSIKRGDIGSVLDSIGSKFDDLGIRITGVSSFLRGFFDLAKIGFSQQLIAGITSLAGGLFSVGAAATQAGAALAGAFISGLGQAIPMLAIVGASLERFKNILQAVSVAGQAEQQHFYDPTEKQVLQLQQSSQIVSANQQLSNSYIQLSEAQQRVRDSQIALTEARYTAQRQITELSMAEKNARLQAEGANLSLTESRRQLQIAIQKGDTAGLAQAELAVKQAELGKQKAEYDVPKAEREARLARQRGVSGAPSVISATEGLQGANIAVLQARQSAEAAKRQKQITELQQQARSSKETQYESQLKFLEKGMSPTELGLTNSLIGIEKELKSPDSPLKKITDYLVEPFTDAIEKIRSLLKDSSFLEPIDELAKAMGAGLSRLGEATFGKEGTSFFETMAKDASSNIPIVVSSLEHLMHIFEDIAKAADPAFHKLSEDWNNFWSRIDKEYEGKGLIKLEEFFTKSVKFAEGFAQLGAALFGLFKALGSDAAPQGLLTVTSFTDAIKEATNWVDGHKSSVVNFFREAREGLSLLGQLLFGIGKSLVEVFSLDSLKAFNEFIQQIILPALRDVVKLLGFLTKLLLEVANAIPGGKSVLEGLAGVFLSLEIVGKITGPIMETVKALKALYAATKALILLEGFSKAWVDAKAAFAGAGVAAATATPEVAGLGGAEGTSAAAAMADTAAQRGLAVGEAGAGGAGALRGIIPAGAGAAATGGAEAAGATAIGAPLLIAAGALAALGSAFLAFKNNFLGVQTQFEKFGDYIKSTFISVWVELSKDINSLTGAGAIKDFVKLLAEAFVELWKVIKIIIPLIAEFSGFIILQGILLVIKTAIEPVIVLFKLFAFGLKAIREPMAVLTSGLELLGKVWSFVWEGMKTVFSNVVSFISERLANVITAIKAIVEIANVNLPVVGHVFGSSLSNVEKSLTKAEGTLNSFGKEVTSHRQHVETEVPKMGETYENVFGKISSTVTSAARITKEGIKSIADQTLNALKALNPGGIQPLSKGGPPLAPGIEKLVQGHATGAYVSATPGGRIARVGEGGHDEVVLSTDPAHAQRSRALLGQYFSRAPHMAAGGFVADPGTNFTVNQEPKIVTELRRLGEYLHTTIYGISGYRSPSHSVEVGGFANDPHTRGEAADIGVGSNTLESASGLTAAILAKFNLYRPFYPASAHEINHVQLIPGTATGIVATSAGTSTSNLNKVIAEISAPKIKGGGAIGQVAQGALNLATKAANIFLSKQTAEEPSDSGSIGSNWSGTWVHVMEQIARAKKWSLSSWKNVVNAESGGDPNARNPSSGAYGLGQFLGSTLTEYAKYGATSSNPVKQIIAMAHYIMDRYGNPTAAWTHEISDHWYAKGGVIGALRSFASGGRAPWGGRPVPIIAHEGERIMNPSQYGETARLAGTSPGGLDRHLGYDGSPRQSFAAGGRIDEQFNRATAMYEYKSFIPENYETGTLSNIIKIFKLIQKGFSSLKKVGNKKYESDLVKVVAKIDEETSGVLAKFQEGREFFKSKLQRSAAQKEYAVKGNQVSLGPQGQAGIDTQSLNVLNEEAKYLEQERNIIKIAQTQADKIKDPESRREALNSLKIKQKEFDEAIDSNIEARYQASIQAFQDGLNLINANYQIQSQKLTNAQSFAQNMGNLSAASQIDEQIKATAEAQFHVLGSKLEEASETGNQELINSIKQEMTSLEATIWGTIAERISNQQNLIQRESQQAESRSSARLGYSKVLAQEGKYAFAGQQEKEALTEKQTNLLSTKAQEEALREQAIREGDTAAVITLGEAISKNNLELAENSLALKENAVITRELVMSQISRGEEAKTGITGSLKQAYEILGSTTGYVNVSGEKRAVESERSTRENANKEYERTGNEIGFSSEGLSPKALLEYLSSPQAQSIITRIENTGTEGEKNNLSKWLSSVETNSIAILKNTEEIAKLNGQLNQPQSFSTSSWNQFRGAFFGGMGQLLPQYASALPPGSFSEMPKYAEMAPGASRAAAPTIGSLSLTHPVERLDPVVFGEQLSHAINTNPSMQ